MAVKYLGGVARVVMVGDRGMITSRRIDETRFGYRRNQTKIAEEAVLDGIYVIRTSVETARL